MKTNLNCTIEQNTSGDDVLMNFADEILLLTQNSVDVNILIWNFELVQF